MKVSVCVVTYNHERYISRSLDGILAQQVDWPLEAVIGEDCSTDRTMQIVGEYASRCGPRFRVLPTSANLGPAQNILRTLAACTGDYVALLEGDDYWTDPEKLRRQVEFLDAHPSYSFCFHPAAEVDSEGAPHGIVPQTARTDFSFADLFPHNFLATSSVLFRRKLAPELPRWMRDLQPGDWPLHMHLAQHGPFRMLPQVMGAYRVHPGGMWSQGLGSRRYQATVRMLTIARPHFAPDLARCFDRGLAVNRFELACVLAAEGHQAAALAELNAIRADSALRPHLPWWKAAALRLAARAPSVIRAAVTVRRWLFDRRHLVPRAASPP
jgi:glycosyltransferase involved in cell wall biosynthesis